MTKKQGGKGQGGIRNILFWSVISAAFIGPGTVATAARAGAQFGAALIWALVFSTLATIILQEMAARLTITTGRSLGEHLREHFSRRWIPVAIWATVAFGCAAYEAGNILGAVAGVNVALAIPAKLVTVVIVAFAFTLLVLGNVRSISRVLGCIVAVMGVAFLIAATGSDLGWSTILKGSLVPAIPDGSILIIIALVGTTIVPYNLFLGSGISKAQNLRSMRFGLPLAIALGGLISIAILVAGSMIHGEMQFETLAGVLEIHFGLAGRYLLGIGLLAAGMTSAITAPLAAAVTARGIFPRWTEKTVAYRAVWLTVLVIGFVLSMLELQPIPVIIAAQALNGMLLPVVAVALFDIALYTGIMKGKVLYRTAGFLVVGVVVFLGSNSLLAALGKAGLSMPESSIRLLLALIITAVVMIWLGWRTLYIFPDRSRHV